MSRHRHGPRMITGSALRRVMKCPGSAKLPQVRTESEHMVRGTVGHRFLERLGNGEPRDKLLAELDIDHRAMCDAIQTDQLGTMGRMMQREVAYAYDVRTGKVRALDSKGHRDYTTCTPTEIPCTIDVAADGYVADYKFGWGSDELTPPCAENEQLAFAALCVARFNDLTEVTAEVIKILPDGSVRHDRATFDVFALDAFEQRIKAMWNAEPWYSRGDHCQYCPSYSLCPAQTAMLLALVKGNDNVGAIEATQAVVERVLALSKLLEEAKRQISELSDQVPIPMGNGRVYGPVAQTHILGARAHEILVRDYGQKLADAACETSVKASQKSIKDAAKETGTELSPRWLDELTAAGATTTVYAHRVHKA